MKKKSIHTETAIDIAQKSLDAANQKLVHLREELQLVEADIELDVIASRTTMNRAASMTGIYRDAAEILGDVAPDDDSLSHVELVRKSESLRAAISIQELRTMDAKRNHGRVVYDDRSSEHDGLVERLTNAFEELYEAVTVERQFCAEITAIGGAPRQLALSETPWLKKLAAQKPGNFRQRQQARGFDV